MKSRPDYHYVDRPEQLGPVLAALDRVDEVFLDTEADNMYHYRTRVCLMQLMCGREIFLIDLLAKLPLDEFWPRLATKHLVMHGSDFDVRLLWDLCEFRPHSLFDTMLAAQLLNRKRIGLAALLEEHFAVKLDKDNQKANWSQRPLAPKLLDYAATDVFYLPGLRDILAGEIARLGRTEWLVQQCRRQIESGLLGFPAGDQHAWRIGKSERLRGAGLSVLYSLWHWREEQAERIDTPPFKVCSGDVLLRFANAAEQGGDLQAVLGAAHLGKRQGRLQSSLVAAIKEGLARDPQTLPRRRGREGAPAALTAEELKIQDRIKLGRDQVAERLQLEPTLIANRSQLAILARSPERLDEILLPWQAELLRPALEISAPA